MQHSEDTKTGNRIPDAPGQQLFLDANWKFLSDWSFDTNLNWIADRKRSENDPRPEIADYTIVNLTLRRMNIVHGLDAAVAARNIFDDNAYEPSAPIIPSDYPLAGRSFWVEISYRF